MLGSPRDFDHGPSRMIRSFVWGLCLAILLFGARTARAAAPMCDETASSRIAPPPVLPIRDVKLEAGSPCDIAPFGDAPVTVAPIHSRGPLNPAADSAAVATEAWVRPSDARIDLPSSQRSDAPLDVSATAKPGFTPGVFRPPRV